MGIQSWLLGRLSEIESQFQAKQVIDCGRKVLMPGLINAHTHVPMTLLRGLADDLRLDVWLMGYMMPVEREFVSPDFVRLGTQLACAEMIRSGVTTLCRHVLFRGRCRPGHGGCGDASGLRPDGAEIPHARMPTPMRNRWRQPATLSSAGKVIR